MNWVIFSGKMKFSDEIYYISVVFLFQWLFFMPLSGFRIFVFIFRKNLLLFFIFQCLLFNMVVLTELEKKYLVFEHLNLSQYLDIKDR